MTGNICLRSETSKITVREKKYKSKKTIRTGEAMIADKNCQGWGEFKYEKIIDK